MASELLLEGMKLRSRLEREMIQASSHSKQEPRDVVHTPPSSPPTDSLPSLACSDTSKHQLAILKAENGVT